MIIMSYLDKSGQYITIKGKDYENFTSQFNSVKTTIPERILQIARGFNEIEQKKN